MIAFSGDAKYYYVASRAQLTESEQGKMDTVLICNFQHIKHVIVQYFKNITIKYINEHIMP